METKQTTNVILDPESFGGSDLSDWAPIATDEELRAIDELYTNDPNLNGCSGWIQTHTGNKFYPQYPDKSLILIEDIAHALSNQCRFTGHTQTHYSVAQHCILVSYFCDEENALYGLLHDASEAYLTDIAAPVKRLPELAGYKELEKKVQSAIMKRFGLPAEEPKDVKRADILVLGLESESFMFPRHPDWVPPGPVVPSIKILPMTPSMAKEVFLTRYDQLTGYKYSYDRIKE